MVPVTPTAPVGFVCPPNVEKAFELAQMIFPLTFGRYSSSYSPVTRVNPPAHSLRHHSFRACHRTSKTDQIEVPRGEWTDDSRYNQ